MKHTLLIAMMIGIMADRVQAQSVQAGVDAWQKGDTAAAVGIWRPLAAKGDADAAFNLGQAYRLGKGVKLDLAQAQGWYEQAAEKNHVEAQTVLGLLLFQNGNKQGAVRWLKPAADAGEPRAMLLYGASVYNGDGGLKADPILGYAYVSRAAAQGLESAQKTLAQLDEVMLLAERKKGVELAQSMAGGKKAAPDPARTVEAVPGTPARTPRAKTVPPKAAAPKMAAPKTAAPITAAPKPGSAGKWRVQLGAFGQRSAAEAMFGKLRPKLAGLTPYYVPAGTVVRFQVGGFGSRADASAACARLAPQPCFPVEGR